MQPTLPKREHPQFQHLFVQEPVLQKLPEASMRALPKLVESSTRGVPPQKTGRESGKGEKAKKRMSYCAMWWLTFVGCCWMVD